MIVVSCPDRYSQLETMTDEEVIQHIRSGGSYAFDYLIEKYARLVKAKARTYFLIGSDRDDVIQEGYIGLYKAICDFDDTKVASFRSFAELCITRQIITSIKTATRMKHLPLNNYVSIYKPVHEEQSDRMLLDVIDDGTSIEPGISLINQENSKQIFMQIAQSLTRLEHTVFQFYIQGYSYEEIATELKRPEKSIDNALQRVKRKINNLLLDEKISNDLGVS